MNATRHVKQWIERRYGLAATEETRHAHATVPPAHGKRIQKSAVTD
jgi:hypothetical protein